MKKAADTMNLKTKAILSALLLAVLLLTGCAPEATPYERNDAEGYTVSVRYDANGGVFTTNTSVIVDSYNISDLETDGAGNVSIALLSPDHTLRGNDAFTAIQNGYFLAGWYTQRTGSEGNYTYSGRWDFEKDRLTVAAGENYTAAEPVLTLYAAWIPLFQIDFYDRATGEYLDSLTFDPTLDRQLLVPAWDADTGAIEMYDFPERRGYTFSAAYYDEAGTQKLDTLQLTHTGMVDYATGTGEDTVMNLYVDWLEGEWYHIYTVEQFLDNASVSGSYVLHADLDFTDEIWPSSLMYGNYSGTIEGNGHTMRNITLEQTNNSKVNAGLFGNLTESAKITDLTLENVTFIIKSGTRVAGASFGLLAGNISAEAQIGQVQILNSCLQIHSDCYFGTDNYTIGLLCGMGSAPVDTSGIVCQAVGEDADCVKITVTGDSVSVEFLTE